MDSAGSNVHVGLGDVSHAPILFEAMGRVDGQKDQTDRCIAHT